MQVVAGKRRGDTRLARAPDRHFRFRPSGSRGEAAATPITSVGSYIRPPPRPRPHPGLVAARVGSALAPTLRRGPPRRLPVPSGAGGRAGRDMGDRKWLL